MALKKLLMPPGLLGERTNKLNSSEGCAKKRGENLLFIDQLLVDGEIVGIYCAFWSIP